MAEYIDRKAAIEICDKAYQERLRMLDFCGDTVAYNIAAEIKGIPAAEVAPVVYGRWRHFKKQRIAVCTACSFERKLGDDFGRAISCPNCGAKMDKEE